MMDELWRLDGLDMKMLTYNCLATGKQVGLIQVVRECNQEFMSLQSTNYFKMLVYFSG